MIDLPDDDLLRYYGARAPEYESIYDRSERQADLSALRRHVAGWAEGRRVLEIACGTGYWTEVMAGVARSVLATDAVEDVLAIAWRRGLPSPRVEFRRADAFALEGVPRRFDALFAGFWISHVAREDLSAHLQSLESRLESGGRLLLLDNRYVPGSSTPVSRRTGSGDTFQRRRLAAGGEYEIRKNFLTEGELRQFVGPRARRVEYREWPHYWAISWVRG